MRVPGRLTVVSTLTPRSLGWLAVATSSLFSAACGPASPSDGTGGAKAIAGHPGTGQGGSRPASGGSASSTAGASSTSGGAVAAGSVTGFTAGSGSINGSGGAAPTSGSSSGGSVSLPAGESGGSSITGGAGGVASTIGGSSVGGASSAKGGSAGVGGASTAGGAGPGDHGDHCVYGYAPDPSDSDPNMKDGPAEYLPSGVTDRTQVDLILQPQVLDWMKVHVWERVHVEWHAIRTCKQGGLGSTVNICTFTSMVPTDQNCQTSGDGYQFLLAHRHMLEILRQLWPKHAEQFAGFPKFPRSAADVPEQWRAAWKEWAASELQAGILGDEIDKAENLSKFPDEGALGFWLQCPQQSSLPNRSDVPKSAGIHFFLHNKWNRTTNTDHGLNNNNANVDNYMFYKLHGWIDGVWARYRKAKGLSDDDPKFKADMVAQCREMDAYVDIIKKDLKPGEVPDPDQPLPSETGDFHTKVRPIFESAKNGCSGCHAEPSKGPYVGLSLGGHLSSKDIVAGLVNKASIDGGQFKLVVPGDPDHSWLYLKASGKAETAGCVATSSTNCQPGVMPPSGSGPTLTADELATLRQWILDGAKGPP